MKFRHAMVCSLNQNRSMEAHSLLKRQGFYVASYGTRAHVKLLGPSLRGPNIYDFGTPYKQMFDDLRRKDPELYKRNGILPMLKRNSGVKLAPQRWQDNAADSSFDVVVTFEEKFLTWLLKVDLNNRDHVLRKCVLIINLEVKDNHEEAAVGARLAFDLCQEIEAAESWEEAIDDIVSGFEKQQRQKLMYSISFY
ncbi:hypothetical protein ACFX13_040236 [Malus domestica]|uniref:uncharacterized protein n=1 Tax=Malus domestica TaxID=3750 RepID=UPI0010AA2CA1|nr:RNA polymerase II subunit A C-terminal domain phosphatase SSU72-like [Malus domestica]XP_050151199.1 uncharacterized protein LOC126626054 [Malus sylvestris]